MENKMTVRLNDEEKKMLIDIADSFTYNGVHSKAIRMCIAFTHQCFKQLVLKNGDGCYNMMDNLNKKFKTNVDDWRYR